MWFSSRRLQNPDEMKIEDEEYNSGTGTAFGETAWISCNIGRILFCKILYFCYHSVCIFIPVSLFVRFAYLESLNFQASGVVYFLVPNTWTCKIFGSRVFAI